MSNNNGNNEVKIAAQAAPGNPNAAKQASQSSKNNPGKNVSKEIEEKNKQRQEKFKNRVAGLAKKYGVPENSEIQYGCLSQKDTVEHCMGWKTARNEYCNLIGEKFSAKDVDDMLMVKYNANCALYLEEDIKLGDFVARTDGGDWAKKFAVVVEEIKVKEKLAELYSTGEIPDDFIVEAQAKRTDIDNTFTAYNENKANKQKELAELEAARKDKLAKIEEIFALGE